jgi:serine/threonine-protein kinase RsbW
MNLTFKKTVPSDPDLIPAIDEFILSKTNLLKLDEDTLSDLSLSVSEAIANAMVHGNKLDPNKNVIVSINISDDELVLSIKDEGEGFDPGSVPDPTKPENIMRDSGRGIHIMRSFIDDVVYDFSSSGTELKLIVKLKK